MKIKHNEYGILNYIKFIGENCDSYKFHLKDISSISFNNVSLIEFIDSNKEIESYVIKAKKTFYGAVLFEKYLMPYHYCDFCDVIFVFQNKTIEYSLKWVDERFTSNYYQFDSREGELFTFTYDIHRKKDLFKTYFFEQVAKDELYINYNDKLSIKDICKIKEIPQIELQDDISKEYLEDLKLFKNVKQVKLYKWEMTDNSKEINELILAMPQLEVIDLNGFFFKEEIALFSKLTNIKKIFVDGIDYEEENGYFETLFKLNLPIYDCKQKKQERFEFNEVKYFLRNKHLFSEKECLNIKRYIRGDKSYGKF